MKYQSRLLIIALIVTIITSMSAVSVSAAYKEDSNNRAIAYVIVTSIGPQVFAARHQTIYGETYNKGTSYIQYTRHMTTSYVTAWSGWFFGSLQVSNARRANFYDSYGNFIKYANIYKDSDMIWDPSWIGYESATGTDVATVNTSTSTAKATFSVFCPEAVYGYSGYTASLYCD